MKSLLAVTAHPDDECFLFGGLLALHAARGGRTGLLCLTNGQIGRTGGLVAPEGLGQLRREELLRATEALQVGQLFAPGHLDGSLENLGEGRGAAIVAGYAERFGADILLSFGPEGASGHKDHKCCWRWTVAAVGERRFYAATFPDHYEGRVRGGPPLPVTTIVDIASIGDCKRRAFLEHRTQQDHLELFDRVQAAFDGREYYHRVHPPWREGDGLESEIGV